MATKRKKAKWQEIGLTEEQYNEVRYQAKLELCRRDFWEFCKVLAPDFYMEGRDYLKELCYALQHLYESDEKILIINIRKTNNFPPRFQETSVTQSWNEKRVKIALCIPTFYQRPD